MKSNEPKIKKLYTVSLGKDKPIVEEWVGFRIGDDAFIGKDVSRRSRRGCVLRRHAGNRVFDTEAAALASMKSAKGYAVQWRGEVIPALIVRTGDGKLKAHSESGMSLGSGYANKRDAAHKALKSALEWHKRAAREFKETQRRVSKLRKILST